MRSKAFVLVMIAAVFFTCKTVEEVLEVGDTVTVEAESLTLRDAEVVSDAAAGGGQAVAVSHITSSISGQVTLPAGVYEVTVYENAPDINTDAIYIQIDNRPPLRTYSMSHGTYAACKKSITISVTDKKTPVTLMITPSETNMKVDKIVFTKLQ
jgi:hypothetical protein